MSIVYVDEDLACIIEAIRVAGHGSLGEIIKIVKQNGHATIDVNVLEVIMAAYQAGFDNALMAMQRGIGASKENAGKDDSYTDLLFLSDSSLVRSTSMEV